MGVSRPTPRGDVEGSKGQHPGGMLRGMAGRGLQAYTRGGGGCISVCTEADNPPASRQLLLRAVRILLECILVIYVSTLTRDKSGPHGDQPAQRCGIKLHWTYTTSKCHLKYFQNIKYSSFSLAQKSPFIPKRNWTKVCLA